jgi:hypothetical protein
MFLQIAGNHIPAYERSTQKMRNLGGGGGLTVKCHICIIENNVLLAKWCNHRVYCMEESLIKVSSHLGICLFFSSVCASLCQCGHVST